MKMSSKILMMVLLLLSFSLPLADRAYAMAQISLQNNSKFWLYLYIDGNFGCGPVMPSGFCTSSVKEGSHRLEARKGGDPSTTIMYEPSVNIGDGTSPTWTVNYEDPDQALLKRLNGVRYVGHRDNGGLYTQEDDLVIHGTTIVWRTRVTWARADVAEAMATGQRGFKKRQIGEWLENNQLQIVGRVASQTVTLYNGEAAVINFTISEDGNSIVYQDGWGKRETFHRQ